MVPVENGEFHTIMTCLMKIGPSPRLLVKTRIVHGDNWEPAEAGTTLWNGAFWTLPQNELGMEPGRYVALLSHSGSRGSGAGRLQALYGYCPAKRASKKSANDKHLRHLSWLHMDTEEGQSYWAAMNLMGRYASANHQCDSQKCGEFVGRSSYCHR